MTKNIIKEKILRRLLYSGILIITFVIMGDIIFFESLYIIGFEHLGEPVPSLYLEFFLIYIYIALYGGFLIIIGYYSFKKDFNSMGKLFTLLGILLAIVALIIFTITAIIDLTLIGLLFLFLLVLFSISISIGFIGIILSITSYKKLNKIIKSTSEITPN
jgi:hypothetical protein